MAKVAAARMVAHTVVRDGAMRSAPTTTGAVGDGACPVSESVTGASGEFALISTCPPVGGKFVLL